MKKIKRSGWANYLVVISTHSLNLSLSQDHSLAEWRLPKMGEARSPSQRGAYCGNFGYASWWGKCQLCCIHQKMLMFSETWGQPTGMEWSREWSMQMVRHTSLQKTFKYNNKGRMTYASFSARTALSRLPHAEGLNASKNNLVIIAEFRHACEYYSPKEDCTVRKTRVKWCFLLSPTTAAVPPPPTSHLRLSSVTLMLFKFCSMVLNECFFFAWTLLTVPEAALSSSKSGSYS